jgi:hypothetical protein
MESVILKKLPGTGALMSSFCSRVSLVKFGTELTPLLRGAQERQVFGMWGQGRLFRKLEVA